MEHTGEFSVGQIVSLRMDPRKHGAVVGVQTVGVETKYSIFIDGAVQQLYASQLLAIEEDRKTSVLSSN